MSHKPSPEPTIGHLLAGVSRLVGGHMRRKLNDIGLNHAQAMILFHLWNEDGMAQNVLAHRLHVTPPTASNTLQRMERDGWVERHRDLQDQRIVRVILTPRAKDLGGEIRATFEALDRELTALLTGEERKNFMIVLKKVHHHLFREGPCEGPRESGRGQEGP
jgi:DNA-binding MarR family transcriptional regulator